MDHTNITIVQSQCSLKRFDHPQSFESSHAIAPRGGLPLDIGSQGRQGLIQVHSGQPYPIARSQRCTQAIHIILLDTWHYEVVSTVEHQKE